MRRCTWGQQPADTERHTYVFTSGTAQNVNVDGLAGAPQGWLAYVKNAGASNVMLTMTRTGLPAALLGTLHAPTPTVDSSIQMLYWTGDGLQLL